jgi:hypothetical protein
VSFFKDEMKKKRRKRISQDWIFKKSWPRASQLRGPQKRTEQLATFYRNLKDTIFPLIPLGILIDHEFG